MPFNFRTMGAALGIVAAAVTIGFILIRLSDASKGVPTRIILSSASAEPLSVAGLQVEGTDVLRGGWTPGSPTPADATPQASADLRVGRPAAIRATLSVPRAGVATCTLEPRPHGVCLVKARFVSATDLRCSFECQPALAHP